jgi:cell division septum initiation protein DivIVA
MDRGTDFLKSQINNATMQHQTFVENLLDHEKQAEDTRFRDLCSRFIPKAQAHQRMLEDYQRELGAETGTAKKVVGKALGMARDLADAARESDFLRLVGDIVTARQAEDTFKTFREAGKQLGLARLTELGEMGERDHDDYHREANRLAQQLFVEYVRAGDTTGLNLSPSTSSTMGVGASGASTSSSGGTSRL